MTAIKIAMREKKKKRYEMGNIYRLAELNQIYDILAELYNQRKQIMVCKVPAHIGIKRN